MQAISEPVLVKRYAGSRLYDTASAGYVTVEDLRCWQAKGMAFVVREAGSSKDITRVVLA